MIATIYKLHDKNQLVYFGSTRQKLYQRLSEHKYPHSRPSTSRLLDSGSMDITILEQYEFDKGEYDEIFIKQRERYYIETFECVNVRVPLRTRKELYAFKKAQSNLGGSTASKS